MPACGPRRPEPPPATCTALHRTPCADIGPIYPSPSSAVLPCLPAACSLPVLLPPTGASPCPTSPHRADTAPSGGHPASTACLLPAPDCRGLKPACPASACSCSGLPLLLPAPPRVAGASGPMTRSRRHRAPVSAGRFPPLPHSNFRKRGGQKPELFNFKPQIRRGPYIPVPAMLPARVLSLRERKGNNNI